MLLNKRTLKDGIIHLVRSEKKFRIYKDHLKKLKFKRREFKFSTFVKVVINQQLSDKASGTIYRRIYSLLDNRVTSGRYLKARVADLRKCGISNQKIKNLKSIATVADSDPRYFSRFSKKDARECYQKLISLNGIGPWSASVITLFYIGHQDVLVEGDVTINKVVSRMYGIDVEKIPARIHKITENWRPYRSVGCIACWHIYDKGLI